MPRQTGIFTIRNPQPMQSGVAGWGVWLNPLDRALMLSLYRLSTVNRQSLTD
jgi:hypothetical protein